MSYYNNYCNSNSQAIVNTLQFNGFNCVLRNTQAVPPPFDLNHVQFLIYRHNFIINQILNLIMNLVDSILGVSRMLINSAR